MQELSLTPIIQINVFFYSFWSRMDGWIYKIKGRILKSPWNHIKCAFQLGKQKVFIKKYLCLFMVLIKSLSTGGCKKRTKTSRTACTNCNLLPSLTTKVKRSCQTSSRAEVLAYSCNVQAVCNLIFLKTLERILVLVLFLFLESYHNKISCSFYSNH